MPCAVSSGGPYRMPDLERGWAGDRGEGHVGLAGDGDLDRPGGGERVDRATRDRQATFERRWRADGGHLVRGREDRAVEGDTARGLGEGARGDDPDLVD